MKTVPDQISKLGFKGDLAKIIQEVEKEYKLAKITEIKYLAEGYEDFNLKLTTPKGKYVLKLFANNQLGDYTKTRRGPEVVERLVNILLLAKKHNLHTPRLIRNKNSEIVFRTEPGLVGILYKWIDGDTYFDLDEVPTRKELEYIIGQVAKINQIDIEPVYYHDIWAVIHIHALYEKVEKFLTSDDKYIMANILGRFDKIPFEKLPHCLVHGDLTKGNVIKSQSSASQILDFSVANWKPRIIDLGLVIANLMYDTKKKTSLAERVELAQNLYQKHIKLTDLEIKYLYDLSLCQAAMEFLGSVWRQNFLDDTSEETKYWLKLGRDGISEALTQS